MCNYTGHEFGATYPDSVCIGGLLWDADSCDVPGGPLFRGGDIPCPACNHEEWLLWQRETIEEQGYFAAQEGQTVCPFDTIALKYEGDRSQLQSWWRGGFEEARKEAALQTNPPS